MSATAPAAWSLDPGTAGQLSAAVEGLHARTGWPRDEVLAAIIRAGLASLETVAARLEERRLDALIAALPADARPAPDVSAYDQLLTRTRRCDDAAPEVP